MYLADIFTIAANLAGICGISVPCGFARVDHAQLPIGLQFLGKAWMKRGCCRSRMPTSRARSGTRRNLSCKSQTPNPTETPRSNHQIACDPPAVAPNAFGAVLSALGDCPLGTADSIASPRETVSIQRLAFGLGIWILEIGASAFSGEMGAARSRRASARKILAPRQMTFSISPGPDPEMRSGFRVPAGRVRRGRWFRTRS